MIELTGTQYRENDIYKIYIYKNIYILYTKERERTERGTTKRKRKNTTNWTNHVNHVERYITPQKTTCFLLIFFFTTAIIIRHYYYYFILPYKHASITRKTK